MADSKRGGYIRIRNSPAQHIIAVELGAKERKKLFPNKVPLLVNAKENKTKNIKIRRSVFFSFFFFDMFTAIVPVMEVRRYNFTGDRSLI